MTRLLFSLALVGTLGLTACQSDTVQVDAAGTTVDTTGTTNVITDRGDMTDMDMDNQPADANVQPETTASAVDGGLTSMAADTAVRNINGWLNRLDGANFPEASNIRGGLRELRGELQRTPIDGREIGNIVADLGAWTTQAASASAPDAMTGLQSLGRSLTNAATGLGGRTGVNRTRTYNDGMMRDGTGTGTMGGTGTGTGTGTMGGTGTGTMGGTGTTPNPNM